MVLEAVIGIVGNLASKKGKKKKRGMSLPAPAASRGPNIGLIVGGLVVVVVVLVVLRSVMRR